MRRLFPTVLSQSSIKKRASRKRDSALRTTAEGINLLRVRTRKTFKGATSRFHTTVSPLWRLAKLMCLSRFVGNIVYPFPQAEIANPLPISPCFQVKATLRRVFERVRRWERTGVRDQWRNLSKRSISGMPHHHKHRARQKGVQASIGKPPRTRDVLNIRERSRRLYERNYS